ncbi:TM2 domain-containing protein [Methanosphaera cuniculi]|uniref:TM2 domain-containing protein n=1 Tax=Methanosphaera cuniculi TaxID=1077256 RepID=UPI0026DA7676|nr:TM2 domain-containing protein [Methanosphaera cuniculi]
MKCPVCEHENDPIATRCSVCGEELQKDEANTTTDEVLVVQSSKDNQQDNIEYTPTPQDNHDSQFDKQQYVQQHPQQIQQQQQEYFGEPPINQQQQGYQQQDYNQEYQQQGYQQQGYNQGYQQQGYQQPGYNPNQRPIHKKSKVIAFILAFLIAGAGYCYLNEWRKGVMIFLICLVCGVFGIFTLFISTIIGSIMWIYTLIDVFGEVDKYNRGEIY